MDILKGDDYMFQIITSEKQKAFEENCIKNKVGSDESECKVPCICGYYGRACRQMNDKADRFLCTGCALADFSKNACFLWIGGKRNEQN